MSSLQHSIQLSSSDAKDVDPLGDSHDLRTIPNADGGSDQGDLPESRRNESGDFGTSAVRVLLVDDHPVVREGLRVGLERFGGIIIDGEAGDGPTAVQLARASQPDVAIVDVLMPAPDGFETAASLRSVSPSTRIALTSGAFEGRCIERGLAVGAQAFILKTDSPKQFAAAVLEIHSGGFCCSESLRDLLVPGPQGFKITQRKDAGLGSLTAREREMFVELAKGVALKEAARAIGVSYKSADHLKQSLMKKLGVHDRVELVRFAIREGLTS